jgi:hypothetical protein
MKAANSFRFFWKLSLCGVSMQSKRPQMSAALRSGLLAILLCASCPQAGEAVAINRALPGEEFLDRQHVAAARPLPQRWLNLSHSPSSHHFRPHQSVYMVLTCIPTAQ